VVHFESDAPLPREKRQIVGTCALCRDNAVELRRSHLMPAAITRWFRMRAASNPNPVWVTPDVTIQMSYEVADHLLCQMCEQRFHQRGEDWVLKNAFRGGTAFPIRERLLRASPVASLPLFDLFEASSIPEIDIDKVCYFAVSVFWRAGAHSWHMVNRRVRIDFGRYEEQLRRYLLDEQPFPEDAALWISVSKTASPFMSASFPKRHRIQNYFQHRFSIPGLAFWLHIGKTLPQAARFLCAVTSPARPICFSDLVEQSAYHDMARLASKTRAVGGLG